MIIDNIKTIELDGFSIDDDNVIISDSMSIGNFKRVKIHLEPNMLKFLIEQFRTEIEKICDIEII